MSERDVERALVRAVDKRGGLCWKFTSPSLAGVPDRFVALPGGRVAFVEVKAPGKCPRPLQVMRMAQLETVGVKSFILDNVEGIEEVLDAIHSS